MLGLRFIKFIKWILLFYFKAFHQIKFYGYENIPLTGPVIIAPNHVSYYDPVFVGAGITRDVEFMAWGRLFSIPILSKMIRLCGAFPVEASKADKSAYVDAIRTLEKGMALIVFPEGKRSDDGEVKEFKPGIARIACRANAMIVPATISGAYEAWPKHRTLPRPKKISVYFHKPISIDKLEDLNSKDKHEFFNSVTNQIREVITGKLEELKRGKRKG